MRKAYANIQPQAMSQREEYTNINFVSSLCYVACVCRHSIDHTDTRTME